MHLHAKYGLTCNICIYMQQKIIAVSPNQQLKAVSSLCCPDAGPYQGKYMHSYENPLSTDVLR